METTREQALLGWCVDFVADLLERRPDEIDVNARFSRIGLDSAMAVQLVVALEEKLDVALAPDIIQDRPTLKGLVAHLVADTRRG
jgi:acyl carrier protein